MSEALSVASERRFAGLARLYGEAAYARYQGAHVCVVGIGGVGSWAVEALARSAVGQLTLIDLDMVAESNVNRQIHALDGQFGKAKVDAMRERISAINPHCQIHTVEDFVSPENVSRLLAADFSCVIDAIDATRTKAAMIAWCRARQMPIVCCGAAGGKQDPTRLVIGDLAHTVQDPLLARVRALLRKAHGFPRGQSKKFAVSAIYSTEPLQRPEQACATDATHNLTGLHCSGYGSAMCVTASFGLLAAHCALQHSAS